MTEAGNPRLASAILAIGAAVAAPLMLYPALRVAGLLAVRAQKTCVF